MSKKVDFDIDQEINKKVEKFNKKIESEMFFQSKIASDSMAFDWLDLVEKTCPSIDSIVREPKLALFKERDVVSIEKAKQIGVASVKDLTTHTHYIEKIDEETGDIQPNKILIERSEETVNTYENRYIYTLITNLAIFMTKKEMLLNDIETANTEILEYTAKTNTGIENVSIELKIKSTEIPKDEKAKDFAKEIEEIKKRVVEIRKFITRWQASAFIKELIKVKASLVRPPIRKTNVILMNPNFQNVADLWNYLQQVVGDDESAPKEGMDSNGDNILKGVLNDAFLMDYFVLDSISDSKREQKDKISKYAIIMFKEQVQRAVDMLLNSGVDMEEDERLKMISLNLKDEKGKMAIGKEDVKEKFEDEMEEYLERAKDIL